VSERDERAMHSGLEPAGRPVATAAKFEHSSRSWLKGMTDKRRLNYPAQMCGANTKVPTTLSRPGR